MGSDAGERTHNGNPSIASVIVLFSFLSIVGLQLVQGAQENAVGNVMASWTAPWNAPLEAQFPYQGLHNSLPELLKVQAQHQRVSVTFFTAPHQPMLLNHIYSLVMFGKAQNYIVAVLDRHTLAVCQELRLPCYNASHLLGTLDLSNTEHTFNAPVWRKLTHLKPNILAEVFRQGVSVHFSDVDVTYIREVWASYDHLLDTVGADASFMSESGQLNSGNFVFRYNERTEKLMDSWLSSPPERSSFLGDQEWLRTFLDKQYQHCSSRDECQKVKDSGKSAVVLHQSQFGKSSWTGHCPGRRPWPVCAPYTLYMHIICYTGSRAKIQWMKYYELWHLDSDNFTPLPQPHSFLPCKNPLAWQEGQAPDPAAKVFPKAFSDANDDDDVRWWPPPPGQR